MGVAGLAGKMGLVSVDLTAMLNDTVGYAYKLSIYYL